MSEFKTIILCGGRINYANLPINTNQSNAMIPINGKPAIGWILDDLLKKGIRQVTIAVREQDRHLRSFLQRAFGNRMTIEMVSLHHDGTILESIQACLQTLPPLARVRIILGDTLIRDSFEGGDDFVYGGRVTDSRRWCLVQTDEQGRVTRYLDKCELGWGEYTALAGYYHLTQGAYLQACVASCIAAGRRELSDVLSEYGKKYPIVARLAQEWFDFGNIDNLLAAKRQLLQTRYFNSLVINPVLNTITKVSAYDDKLADELDWYLTLPQELQILAPRIVSHERVNGQAQIVQEYYGYPTLAELFVYGDLYLDTWHSILARALQIHREFRKYPGTLSSAAVESMYVAKTWQRLEDLNLQDPAWHPLLSAKTINFNGRSLRGIPVLATEIHRKAHQLAHTTSASIIHGDYCFSNILFDLNNQIIRLIDPRGSFGVKGNYGDPRYDVAKLRHSAHELYDFILADMFELREAETDFQVEIYADGIASQVGEILDRMIVELGYDLDEIRFIEGLLFISMLPIHHEQLQRQKVMFLTGLALLNEVL
ncbi:hypothetical protein FBQ82_00985 [Anaerolineae bacterium CFX7]|nr:hypothetical protein [Anaerolineae bacterium CFX7]